MRAILTAALGAGLLCCFAFAQDSPEPNGKQKKAAVEQEEKVYPKTYRVDDLPVWSKAGEFAPELLMRLVQSSVDSESWEAAGGPSTMAPYPKNASLVVSTTNANHEAVKQLLERLRK